MPAGTELSDPSPLELAWNRGAYWCQTLVMAGEGDRDGLILSQTGQKPKANSVEYWNRLFYQTSLFLLLVKKRRSKCQKEQDRTDRTGARSPSWRWSSKPFRLLDNWLKQLHMLFGAVQRLGYSHIAEWLPPIVNRMHHFSGKLFRIVCFQNSVVCKMGVVRVHYSFRCFWSHRRNRT